MSCSCSFAEQYLQGFDGILQKMGREMLTRNSTAGITDNFICCMIPHHAAAVSMCQNLLGFSDYQPLASIAENIMKTQTAGIREMREIAATSDGYGSTCSDMRCYRAEYMEIVNNMLRRMRNSRRTIDIALNFVNEMIPHHEGAIAMCENLLQYCIDPRLAQLAENIITEQSEGVKELKEIRKNLRCCGNAKTRGR